MSLKSLKTTTVIRITVIKGLNNINPEQYAELIEKANPKFIEIKAYMWVGYSRQRLEQKNMPRHEEVKDFSKQIASEFLDVIDRAVMGNYLKVFWLNRRLRMKVIESFLLEDFSSMTRASNIELIKQKKVHSVLTLNPQLYTEFGIPCINVIED